MKRLSLIFNQSIATIYKIKREFRRNARLTALCEDVIPCVVPHLEQGLELKENMAYGPIVQL